MDLLTFSLGLSLHLGFTENYNNIHPHVRYQNEHIVSGVYYNSESSISAYLGKEFKFKDLGLELGVVSGYSMSPVVPMIRATYKNFYIIPAVEGSDFDPGIVIGYEFKF